MYGLFGIDLVVLLSGDSCLEHVLVELGLKQWLCLPPNIASLRMVPQLQGGSSSSPVVKNTRRLSLSRESAW